MSRAPYPARGPEAYERPPAPVVTDYGTYGELPRRSYGEPEPRRRPSLARIATFLLALGVGAWVVALSAWQATSRTVAVPVLERTIAALADVDALLVLHEDAVREEAQAARPGERVAVPGFPVPAAQLDGRLARTGTREQWRDALLAAGATAVYEDGIGAFAQGEEPLDGGALSTSGGVRRVMQGIGASTHGALRPLVLVIGGVVGLLALVVLIAGDGARRFVALGLALIFGAVLGALGGVAATLLVLVAGNDDSQLAREVAGLARMLAWLPVLTALRVAAAGLAILVPAIVVAIVTRRREDGEYTSEYDTGYAD